MTKKKLGKGSWLTLGAMVAVLAIVAMAGWGWSRSSQAETSAGPGPGRRGRVPTVQVETARRTTIIRTLGVTGEVVPVSSMVVGTTMEGPIVHCPWREGDQVSAGEKLLEIDRQSYRAEVLAARSALVVAEARLADMRAGTRPEDIAEAEQQVREWQEMVTRGKADFDRAERLVESGAVSRGDFVKSRAEFHTAQAKLAAAESRLERLRAGPTTTEIAVQEALMEQAAAALEVSKARLAECVVTAPFDGTVTAVHVHPGDIATPRTPLLEVVDMSSLVVRFAVREAFATAIRPDMLVNVALDAYPGQSLRAVVTRVYPVLDSTMRTRTVEATLVEPHEIVPGMFGRLELELEASEDTLVVAQEAIIVTPQGERVLFVVVDGEAQQRTITTGIEQGSMVEVLEGLQEGDQVVVAGNERLRSGVQVAVSTVEGRQDASHAETGDQVTAVGARKP